MVAEARKLPDIVMFLLFGAIIFCFTSGAILNASFVADDYRYLHLLHGEGWEFWKGLLRGVVVENRWDTNWWVEEGGFVKFFRPFVILSFAIDKALWGVHPSGFVITNVLLHTLVTFLVWRCFQRTVGRRAALLGTLIFAIHPVHAENLYYISGRTDTIAALFFFSTILCYWRYLNEPTKFSFILLISSYFFALCAKEYNILLIVFLFFLDATQSKQRREMFIGLIIITVLYLLLRSSVIGQQGDLVEPYFFTPFSEGFFRRTVTLSFQYVLGLLVGAHVPPTIFSVQSFWSRFSIGEILLVALFLFSLLLLAFNEDRKKSLWFLLVLCGSVAPLLLLYSSARYLYLPSFALCGLIAIGIVHKKQKIFRLCAVVLIALFTFQLSVRLSLIPQFQRENVAKVIGPFEKLLSSEIVEGKKLIFVLDFPFSWLHYQLLQQTVEESIGQPMPKIQVLTIRSNDAQHSSTTVKWEGDTDFKLSKSDHSPLYDREGEFKTRRLNKLDRIQEAEYSFTSLKVTDGKAIEALIESPYTQDQVVFVRY